MCGLRGRNRDFNPRSHEGSDAVPLRCMRDKKNFNPRSHEGSDLLCSALVIVFYFNPRSHEGSDGKNHYRYTAITHFNPRSHEGSDHSGHQKLHDTVISIHAPTRGATPLKTTYLLFRGISIHAPTRGATQTTTAQSSRIHHFNPRSHEGSDLRQIIASRSLAYFNPRSHEGSDCKSAQKLSVFYTLLLLSLHNLMNNYNTFSDNI